VVAVLVQWTKGKRYDDEEFGMRDAPVYSDGVYCGPPGLSNVDCGPKSDKSLCTRLPDICTRVDPFIHHFFPFVNVYINIYIFLFSMHKCTGSPTMINYFQIKRIIYGLFVYGISQFSRDILNNK
jgi:hypothetical protein